MKLMQCCKSTTEKHAIVKELRAEGREMCAEHASHGAHSPRRDIIRNEVGLPQCRTNQLLANCGSSGLARSDLIFLRGASDEGDEGSVTVGRRAVNYDSGLRFRVYGSFWMI